MEIKIEVAGARLDKALADLTPLSRAVANEQIKEGKVLVNGTVKKAKYTVKEGDIIQYEVPEVEEVSYEAEDLPLDIVYEDQDVVVVNKPQGMVVHPSAGHTSGTLVNALLYHVKDLSGINGELRPGIVHRIDKDTSGLLMVAKNDQAHVALADELKDKKSLRKYWAIVHGNLPNDRGMIEAPIGRSEKDRKKQAVTAKGKPAVTRFQVLERFGNYTLVELQLETGRTHQIRVHMAYIGHPVAGDPAYGPKKTLKGQGQFLHARTLGFTHPRTGETLEFTAEVPAIFEKTLEDLGKISRTVNMKILVSLSCTMCPELVTAAQRIAAENPFVTAEVYDLNHFPALKGRYQVMSVPCLVINDGEKVVFGKKNVGQVVELINSL